MSTLTLGADHAGFEMKGLILTRLAEQGYDVTDVGTDSLEPVDYPFYAGKVAESVRETGNLGILLCGSGGGMSIAANRYNGIYAIKCANVTEARTARKTGANILCLRGKSIYVEDSWAITDAFLKAEFSGEERHQKRLDQIDGLFTG